uniref:Uncharacterized protein n=1 Tax=Anguilla anguilla TaxID=7936 RepID=A0A0E9T6Y7_ANGAN
MSAAQPTFQSSNVTHGFSVKTWEDALDFLSQCSKQRSHYF